MLPQADHGTVSYVICPRCGSALEPTIPGGKNPARLSVTVLACINPAGCIGPLVGKLEMPAAQLPGGDRAIPAPQAGHGENTTSQAITPVLRRSTEIPGLTLELDGAGYLTFRYGTWFITYRVTGGKAVTVDCSDRGEAPWKVYQHVGHVAQAYASRLAEKAVA